MGVVASKGSKKSGKFGRSLVEEIEYQKSILQKMFPGHVIDYAKLQEQILAEYPSIKEVRNSLLVSDNRLPDCPIVYCSDAFEKLTLFPKEFALGRNCRFLQGKFTDRHVVAQVAESIRRGVRCDVELLNYRKDKTPFWNAFTVLPVHAPTLRNGGSPGPRPVEFFVAVQRDFSLLIDLPRQVAQWNAVEVAIWLERSGLSHLAPLAVEKEISGQRLLTVAEDSYSVLSGFSAVDRRSILDLMHRVIVSGEYILQLSNMPEFELRDDLSTPSSDLSMQNSEDQLQTLNSQTPAQAQALIQTPRLLEKQAIKVVEPSSSSDKLLVPIAMSSVQLKQRKRPRMAVKCRWGSSLDGMEVILIRQTTPLRRFREKIQWRFGDEVLVYLPDPRGNRHVPIEDEMAWADALVEAFDTGDTLEVILRPERRPLPLATISLLEGVCGVAIIVFSGFLDVLFANADAMALLCNTPLALLPRLSSLIPSVEFNKIDQGFFMNVPLMLPLSAGDAGTILLPQVHIKCISSANSLRVMSVFGAN